MTPENKDCKLPRRVVVQEVVASRYKPGARPVLWERRFAGCEEILTKNNEALQLASSGGQSSPAPGWELLLTACDSSSEDGKPKYTWTLYGTA